MRNFLLLLLIIPFWVQSQNEKIIPVFKQKTNICEGQFLGEDLQGYDYFDANNTLIKTNNNHTLNYKNITLGKINKIDLINPLRILVFYENFNTIILLDNQLNETTKINFSDHTKPIIAHAVGMSSNNNLWLFNSLNQTLGLYNYINSDYKTIANPFTKRIEYYQTDFNHFYWIDETKNAYQCNIFGKITFLTKIENYDKIQFLDAQHYLIKSDNLLSYITINADKTITKNTIEIEEKSFKDFYYLDHFLVIFTSLGKTNYKIILP